MSELKTWALKTWARFLSDVDKHFSVGSGLAHRAHLAVMEDDLGRRRKIWDGIPSPSWNEADVLNGHEIPWGSRDPNLESAMADRELEVASAKLAAQEQEPSDFQALVRGNL